MTKIFYNKKQKKEKEKESCLSFIGKNILMINAIVIDNQKNL